MDFREDDIARRAPAPLLMHLIENAAASFEADRAASRSYLMRACQLIRVQVKCDRASKAASSRGGLPVWQAKRVISHIDQNLTAPLSTQVLAGLVDLSASHFHRSFKVSVGLSPREYVTRRRFELALDLLANTAEPISQIALACGLNDQSSFCRAFRRAMGQSPREWRRIHGSAPTARLARRIDRDAA